MKKTFDLTILGAGIIGSWAAYYISKLAPELKILVIDKSLIGRGATQYSLGLSYPYGKNPVVKTLVKDSILSWQELSRLIPKLSIKPLDVYALTNKEQLNNYLCDFSEIDPHFKKLPAEILQEVKQKIPFALFPENQNLLGVGKGSIALAGNVTQELTQYLRQKNKNLQIFEGIEVKQLLLNEKNAAIKLITLSGEEIYSHKIILALGPWLIEFLKHNQLKVRGGQKLRTKKIVTLHFNKRPAKNAPMIFLLQDESILIPNPFQRQWQFSFKAETWDCTPDINQLAISAEDQNKAFSILKRYCPRLLPQYRGGRVFCDTYGEDATPLYTELFESSNIAIAGAGSGIGFRLAPAIARNALKILYPEL